MPVVISVVIFLAMLAALFDVISRDDSQIKGLPKLVWLLLIVFIPVAGSILWFVAGRAPRESSYPSPRHPSQSTRTGPALFDRSGSRPAALPPAPLSTEEQLAALEREITEQEELDRIRQLEAEIEERRTAESD